MVRNNRAGLEESSEAIHCSSNGAVRKFQKFLRQSVRKIGFHSAARLNYSIHKTFQGCTCGEGEVCERVVVNRPDTNGRRNTSCLEQVGLVLTRAKEIGCLALSDYIEVTREMLLKLGRSKAYIRLREFEETLRSIASQKKPRHILLPRKSNVEGGFLGLVAWYRNRTGTS